jgi:hypothetical protein
MDGIGVRIPRNLSQEAVRWMSAVKDLTRHLSILQASYRRWTGKSLLPADLPVEQAAAWLESASFGLVSHGAEADPIFNYANCRALQLFGMTWDAFTQLPSRLSAGPVDREERTRLLERVARDGFTDDYTGIRVAADGRQFLIRNATVWNLLDEAGHYYGQAAMIPEWNDVL